MDDIKNQKYHIVTKKYPITDSLYFKSGHAGYCNICGELTEKACLACPKWLCESFRCNIQHGKDETEGRN